MVKGLKLLSCKEGLLSLEKKMTEEGKFYKMMNGVENVEDFFFLFHNTGTQNH